MEYKQLDNVRFVRYERRWSRDIGRTERPVNGVGIIIKTPLKNIRTWYAVMVGQKVYRIKPENIIGLVEKE